jgi:thymidylate synthase
VKLQLTRKPEVLPKLKMNAAVNSIFDFKYEDFELENYQPHPAIKGQVAI